MIETEKRLPLVATVDDVRRRRAAGRPAGRPARLKRAIVNVGILDVAARGHVKRTEVTVLYSDA